MFSKGNLYNTISTGLNTIYPHSIYHALCGFTENYVEDADDLEKLAKRHRVDFENQEFVNWTLFKASLTY